MPGDYRYRIGAQDDASGVLEKLARNSRKAMRAVQDDLDASSSKGKQLARVLDAMADDIESDLRGTEAAASALANALGPELATEANRMVEALRAGGLTLDEIEQDAEDLARTMRRLDDVARQAGGGLRNGLTEASDGVRRIGDEADQSRSVLANMVGNTVQELPGISAAAGPVAMALGQLGEYAAEGNISLKNLAATAGPMAALGVGLAVVSSIMNRNANEAKRAKELQEGYAEAIREGTDAIREQSAINFIDSAEIRRAQQLGVSLDVLADAVTGAGDEIDDWQKAAADAFDIVGEGAISVEELARVMARAGLEGSPLAEEFQRLAANGDLTLENFRSLASELDTLSTAYGGANTEADRSNAIYQALGVNVRDAGEAAREAADPVQTLAERQQELADASEAARDMIDGTADAIRNLHDQSLEVVDAQVAYQEAIDGLAQSIRGAAEDGSEFNDTLDDTTERGRENIRAARDVASSIATLISTRLRETGSLDEARRAGELYVEDLKDQLRQAGLTRAEVDEYLETLNLTPEDISTVISLAGAQQAQEFVETYGEQLDGLTAERQTIIQALIDQGKYNEAADLLDFLSRSRVVPISINPNFGVGTSPLPALPGMKFHTGEDAGVVPGPIGHERLAMVTGGETIRTPQQEAALANGVAGLVVSLVQNFYGTTEPDRAGTEAHRAMKRLALELS